MGFKAIKRVSLIGVTVAAMLATGATSAHASSLEAQPSTDRPVVALAVASQVDQAIVTTIVDNVRAAQLRGFSAGQSEVVYQAGSSTLSLAKSASGEYVLTGDSKVVEPAFGFCHAAAMAAVYSIGAAAFLAASLIGGIVVFGVAISASAAGALSAALAAGAGVSALVAVYIC